MHDIQTIIVAFWDIAENEPVSQHDFGMGHSPLNYLNELVIHKGNNELVRDMLKCN